MDVEQLLFTGQVVTLIIALIGTAIANKVFNGGNDMLVVDVAIADIPLQAGNDGARILSHNSGIFGVTFVGAAPAVVTDNCNGGGKNPVYTGGTYFFGGSGSYFFN